MSGRTSQARGRRAELELARVLQGYGYQVEAGRAQSYGEVPDLSGLPGVHIECKRCEQLLNKLKEEWGGVVAAAPPTSTPQGVGFPNRTLTLRIPLPCAHMRGGYSAKAGQRFVKSSNKAKPQK